MSEEDHVLKSWDEHEKKKDADEKLEEVRAQYNEETNPSRRCLHANVITISVICTLALFLMAIGQIVAMMVERDGPISYVLRSYVLVLCILGMLVELEWTQLANSKILNFWITRGMFYAFVGVLGLEENDTNTVRDEHWAGDTAALLYLKVTAWIMIGMGGLYFLMGLVCCQLLYNRQREDYMKRRERARTVRETTERYGGNPHVV